MWRAQRGSGVLIRISHPHLLADLCYLCFALATRAGHPGATFQSFIPLVSLCNEKDLPQRTQERTQHFSFVSRV